MGDSIALGLVPPLQAALEQSGHRFRARWFVGFLDPFADEFWSALIDDPPDVAIMLFAPWETATLATAQVVDATRPGWEEAYVRDYVGPRIARLRGTGTELIWIGMPPARDPALTERYDRLNAIWRATVEREPAMTWIDGGRLLGDEGGGYLEVDRTVSPPRRLYQVDGEHLCPEGGRRLAVAVLTLLRVRYDVTVELGTAGSEWAEQPDAYPAGTCPDPV